MLLRSTPSGGRKPRVASVCRDDILRRLFTFIAFFYPQFAIAWSIAEKRRSDRPGSRVHLGIGERGLVMERVVVNERQSLNDMQRLAGEISGDVEPCLPILVGHVDHEHIALPSSARVAVPQSDTVSHMGTPIHRYNPVTMIVGEEQDVVRRLMNQHAVR